MAAPSEKLARSLQALKDLQDRGVVAIRSSDLGRIDRERLVANGFLQAVIKNDLMETYMRADDINVKKIYQIVRFMYLQAPRRCHGSRQKMDDWEEKGGLRGILTNQ